MIRVIYLLLGIFVGWVVDDMAFNVTGTTFRKCTSGAINLPWEK